MNRQQIMAWFLVFIMVSSMMAYAALLSPFGF